MTACIARTCTSTRLTEETFVTKLRLEIVVQTVIAKDMMSATVKLARVIEELTSDVNEYGDETMLVRQRWSWLA